MAEKKKKGVYQHLVGLLDRAADPLGKEEKSEPEKSEERREAERREQMRRLPPSSPARIAYEKNQKAKKKMRRYGDNSVSTGKVKHY